MRWSTRSSRSSSTGQLFAWIWGHEHHLFEFADYRGVKCRCIGHGSLPYVPPDRRRRKHDAEIVRMETRPSPLSPSRGMHGFALLTFDGPSLAIEYVDEVGGTHGRNAGVERPSKGLTAKTPRAQSYILVTDN